MIFRELKGLLEIFGDFIEKRKISIHGQCRYRSAERVDRIPVFSENCKCLAEDTEAVSVRKECNGPDRLNNRPASVRQGEAGKQLLDCIKFRALDAEYCRALFYFDIIAEAEKRDVDLFNGYTGQQAVDLYARRTTAVYSDLRELFAELYTPEANHADVTTVDRK